MRAVCYPRVSSAIQRDKQSIDSQIRELPEFAERMGWPLVKPVEAYIDDGFTAKSGRLDKRRGLRALLRDAALGLFDVVVMVDFNRLTRAEDLAERGMILGALQAAGVRVATTSGELLDLNTEHGDLIASLMGARAAAENRAKAKSIRNGKLTAALRGGKATGRDPFGLKYSKAAGWSLDPLFAPIARDIVERVAAGESCYAIADDLNARGIAYPGLRGNTAWHRGRVYDLVRSRHVVGEYIAHAATHTTVTVPEIVDEATWQLAQDTLASNRKAPLRKTKHIYLLEGIARCGDCGGRMLVQSGCLDRGRFWRPAVYLCEHRKNRKMGPDRCSAVKVHVDDIDARAWAAVCRELNDPGLPGRLAELGKRADRDAHDWAGDAAGYRAHLARLEKVETAVMARFRRGDISEGALDNELVAMRRERTAVRAQLATAERAAGERKSVHARAGEVVAGWDRLRAALAVASPAECRAILLTMVRPGGVTLIGSTVRVELFVPRGVSVDSRSRALADVSLLSDVHESTLRIRLVA